LFGNGTSEWIIQYKSVGGIRGAKQYCRLEWGAAVTC